MAIPRQRNSTRSHAPLCVLHATPCQAEAEQLKSSVSRSLGAFQYWQRAQLAPLGKSGGSAALLLWPIAGEAAIGPPCGFPSS